VLAKHFFDTQYLHWGIRANFRAAE
jgi:hypothetical protein